MGYLFVLDLFVVDCCTWFFNCLPLDGCVYCADFRCLFILMLSLGCSLYMWL